MNVLHIAPHLGGGVGKAHSAVVAASAPDLKREYLLLEEPRDPRYVEALEATGASLRVMPTDREIFECARAADIVQIEWWNHPRIYELLCRKPLPAIRSVFWSHISGICSPYIPAGLVETAHRFLFTSKCSLSAPNIVSLSQDVFSRIDVVNSGFGYDRDIRPEAKVVSRTPTVSYLGTVEFSKMSPLLFDAIDRMSDGSLVVRVWGGIDPTGEVSEYITKMRNPGRVRLMGHARESRSILAETDIFLYLLQPNHYGTAENALIEAMSLGCTPLVLSNPAEMAIVRHGETGFAEPDLESVVSRLEWMMANPDAVSRLGQCAAAEVSETRTPELSAAALERNYRMAMEFEKREVDYSSILGNNGLDWYLSTQALTSDRCDCTTTIRHKGRNKGSLLHFVDSFPDDRPLLAFASSVLEAGSVNAPSHPG